MPEQIKTIKPTIAAFPRWLCTAYDQNGTTTARIRVHAEDAGKAEMMFRQYFPGVKMTEVTIRKVSRG